MVALMALSLSSTFVSCSDNDDDEPNFAKEIAGAYKGYSVGACNMFSDYLLGDESTATITANEDGTINLVYKSGSGDFTLNNLKLSSNKSFSGSGEVAMSMGGSTGGSYDYTLEGSVDGSKVLSLKANVDIPVPMGKMEIDFIQGETPVGYYIKDTYKYQTNLSLKVQGGEVGSTTDCQVKIENPTGSTVNVTISGFNNAGGSMSNFEKFTVTRVNVTKANNGSYSLSLGAFEADTQKTTGEALAINGTSLNGTINADGTATVSIVFSPGSMPMPITAEFTGSNTQSSAQFKYTIVLGAAMSLSACNGIFENIYDAPIETEMEIKENSFSQVKTVEYTEWAYINLSERTVTTVKIGEEYESQIPDKWDFAIHRYDIKTNEGATYKTTYTSIDEFKATGKLPKAEDFVEDEWTTDKIAIDMSGMMDGNIIYTESYRNAVLSSWLDVNTATMPPVYTMSNQVFLIRLKDNTYAAIRFTNYMNARGIKGYIDFNFQYPLEFEDNNNETNQQE